MTRSFTSELTEVGAKPAIEKDYLLELLLAWISFNNHCQITTDITLEEARRKDVHVR